MTARARLRPIRLAAALIAAGAPAWAQDLPQRAAAFVAVVQANACALTEAEAEALLPPAGLTMEDARDAAALLNRGRLFTVDDDGQTLRLVPDLCAADAAGVAAALAVAAEAPEVGLAALGERVDPARGAAFVQLVRANGCTMTEAQAEASLPAQGFTPDEVQDIAGLLMVTGRAGMAGDAFALDPALCAADPAGDGAVIAAAAAEYAAAGPLGPVDDELVRSALVAMAVVSDCTLDAADPGALGAAVMDWLGLDDGAEALGAVLAGVLADPGPEFTLEDGRLRLATCSP